MQELADRPRNHRSFTPRPVFATHDSIVIGGHLRKRPCLFRGTGLLLGAAAEFNPEKRRSRHLVLGCLWP